MAVFAAIQRSHCDFLERSMALFASLQNDLNSEGLYNPAPYSTSSGVGQHGQFFDQRGTLSLPPEDDRGGLGPGSLGTVTMVRITVPSNKRCMNAVRQTVTIRNHELPNQSVRRLVREPRINQGLKHEHIVRIIDPCEATGFSEYHLRQRPLCDMNLADFMHHIQPSNGWPGHYDNQRNELPRFIGCLTSALNSVHQSGQINILDITPSNILVRQVAQGQGLAAGSFTVLFCDFGLSPRGSDGTNFPFSAANQEIGARRYVAPELMREENGGYPYRSDTFSLGCIFTEMLTLIVSPWTLEDLMDYIKYQRPGRRFHGESYYCLNIENTMRWLSLLKRYWDRRWSQTDHPGDMYDDIRNKIEMTRRMLAKDYKERIEPEEMVDFSRSPRSRLLRFRVR